MPIAVLLAFTPNLRRDPLYPPADQWNSRLKYLSMAVLFVFIPVSTSGSLTSPCRPMEQSFEVLTHGSFVCIHSCIYVWIPDLPLQTNGTVEHQEVETAVRHVGGMGRVEDKLSPKVPVVNLYYIFYTKYHLFVFVWNRKSTNHITLN